MKVNPAYPQHNLLVQLVARPQGEPLAEHFRFIQKPCEPLAQGAAWVKNIYFSVDPYMRESMDEDWPLDQPLEGRTIGRVIASSTPALQPGDWVLHRKGWRTYSPVTPTECRVLPCVDGVPLRAWLSLLGGTGLTAWVALTKIVRIQAGESLYISAAAGGVGSAVGQFAKLLGAKRIIGSTGRADKARYLTDRLGYTDAFVYQPGQVSNQLRDIAPEGIDIYLDNVGGEQLEAAIDLLNDFGRVALIGAVAQYNALAPPCAPRNLFDVVGKSLRLEGFLVRDYQSLQTELEQFALPHIQTGRLVLAETVIKGFDHIVAAFLSMLKGGNNGKMIVSLEEDEG